MPDKEYNVLQYVPTNALVQELKQRGLVDRIIVGTFFDPHLAMPGRADIARNDEYSELAERVGAEMLKQGQAVQTDISREEVGPGCRVLQLKVMVLAPLAWTHIDRD